ncbi:hypothetical protein, partial [Poseidonibacter sp.]|uniref:hypothetical protein n=1 Tax=Poseidonibacter sp. TaxID=2321188 RepID=UPI003C76C1DB
AYNHEETSFNSSTLGAITSAFTAAASIIGDISSGHADPEQVSAGIGDTLSSLSETTSKNYEKNKNEIVFLSSKPDDKGRSKSIVGIKYRYKFCVEDYADKKEETHKSSSEIEQWNIVFTSVDVFKEVVKYVVKLKKNNQIV